MVNGCSSPRPFTILAKGNSDEDQNTGVTNLCPHCCGCWTSFRSVYILTHQRRAEASDIRAGTHSAIGDPPGKPPAGAQDTSVLGSRRKGPKSALGQRIRIRRSGE